MESTREGMIAVGLFVCLGLSSGQFCVKVSKLLGDSRFWDLKFQDIYSRGSTGDVSDVGNDLLAMQTSGEQVMWL